MMNIEETIQKIAPGQKILYHTGDLAIERLKNPELDNVANALYARAAPKHFIIAYDDRTAFVQKGQGRGQLTQQRLGDHQYNYFYTENSNG